MEQRAGGFCWANRHKKWLREDLFTVFLALILGLHSGQIRFSQAKELVYLRFITLR